MDTSAYVHLYDLQDKVLATVFEEPLGFYLTGGTALSRFYLSHRYSDDLDFFTHDIGVFPDAFRLIYAKIQHQWSDLKIEVDGRDFKRIRIVEDGTRLKLDFVADRVSRIGLPMPIGMVYVDTIRNILSNKLSAIMGRDEARDIADLIFIARKRVFSWAGVVKESSEKAGFQLDDLLYRLSTFPVQTLRTVPFVREEPLDVFSGILDQIRTDLAQLGDNSVAEPGAAVL